MKLYALAVVMTMVTIMATTEAGLSSVDIINWSTGEPMWVHCKSGDNDLQWQLLQIKQDYRFEFHESILMNTVFWCRFVWGPNGKYWQAFTVWDRMHPWDMPLACGNCTSVWRSENDGMYIWDKIHQQFDFWKAWNVNTDGLAAFANDSSQDSDGLAALAKDSSASQAPWEEPSSSGPGVN